MRGFFCAIRSSAFDTGCISCLRREFIHHGMLDRVKIRSQIGSSQAKITGTESMYSQIRIPLFVGQINIKLADRSLYSERYGLVPSFCFFGIRFTWRRWRGAL